MAYTKETLQFIDTFYDSKKEKNGKRYSVCGFPSLHGTPWDTDSKIIARVLSVIRTLKSPGLYVEIHDNLTEERIE